MAVWMLLAVAAAVAFTIYERARRNRQRRKEAANLARALVPEVRGLMESCNPRGRSDGEPATPKLYEANRQRLPHVFPSAPLFAVETFYQCVESYRRARASMKEAFPESEDDARLSLGERIRAKDRRDRCLKDVYYTGEAAIQKLEGMFQ